ncbi:MAG: cytochrome c biogenesis protein CcsA [Thiohalomonadaceae bacterium]
MTIVLTFTAIACYFAATMLLLRRLAAGATANELPRLPALLLGLAGVALHGFLLHKAVFLPFGLNLHFFSMISLITWLAALLLLLAVLSQPVENLGNIIFPLSALGLVMQTLWPMSDSNLVSLSTEVQIHVLISVLAYSLLALAAVQAMLLAVQDHQLRNRHPGGFIRALPPLETMEKLLFRMIGLGFLLLSLSLLTGFLYLEDIFAQHLVHKTVLSVIAWAVFAVLLWGRWRIGWRGRKAITWSLAGFIVLMIAYLGSKLVLELILQH